MPYPAKLDAEQILEAAQILLDERGPADLSLRPLADALGVRPSSLYRHFAGRDALLAALGDRAAQALHADFLAAAEGLPPRAALTAAAHAYLHYARTQAHAYALLLTAESPTPGAADTSAGKALWNTLLRLVGALSGDPDDTDHTVALWTFLHGFAGLERSGMFGASGPRGGLEVGLGALLDSMERQAGSQARGIGWGR